MENPADNASSLKRKPGPIEEEFLTGSKQKFNTDSEEFYTPLEGTPQLDTECSSKTKESKSDSMTEQIKSSEDTTTEKIESWPKSQNSSALKKDPDFEIIERCKSQPTPVLTNYL